MLGLYKIRFNLFPRLPFFIVIGLLFGFSLWSLYAPLLFGRFTNDVRAIAITLSVCDVGCDYATIAEADTFVGNTSTEYIIEVRDGYTSSTEPFVSTNFNNLGALTLQCESGVIIGSSTGQFFFNLTDNDIVQNCSFDNVIIRASGGTSYSNISIRNNTFATSTGRASSINMYLADLYTIQGNIGVNTISLDTSSNGFVLDNTVHSIGSGGISISSSLLPDSVSNITVSNNTVTQYDGNTDYSLMRVYAGIDLVFSTNTFSYVNSTSSPKTAVSISNSTGTFYGNLLARPEVSHSHFGDILLAISANTTSIPTEYTISHNTFVSADGSGIRIDKNANGVTMSVTSTYNIFYSTSSSIYAVGLNYFPYGASGITVNTSSDYNGFWNLNQNLNYEGLPVDIGLNSFVRNPFFSNTTTYNEIYEFSSYFDVNGNFDIGHISQPRVGVIPIGSGNIVMDFDTVSTTVRAGDTLNFGSGIFSALTILSLNNITVSGLGPSTIFSAGANQNALTFISSNGATVQDITLSNASTTISTSTITNSVARYGGFDYNDAHLIEAPANSSFILASGSSSCDIDVISADGANVSAYLNGIDNIHLGTGTVFGSARATMWIPDNYASSVYEIETLCSGVGLSVDAFALNAFSVSEGSYVYNAGSLSSAGITIASGFTDPPSISREVSSYAGLKFVDSSFATIQNVTSSDNGYSVWFSGVSSGNTVSSSSFFGSSMYDIRSDSSEDNNLKNVLFDTASSSISSFGNIDVYYKVRAYTTGGGSPLGGVSVTFTRGDENASSTLTTDDLGYTDYTDFLLSFIMTSSSIDITNGGYNPWTVYSAASSTYLEKTIASSFNLQNQTITLAMETANNAPSVSDSLAPLFPSDGTGFVVVTTTLTDSDDDISILIVEYSIDGGSTWASSTLGNVSGDGSPTTSTGQISDITSTSDGNALTFTWNSQADGVGTETTVKIRIIPHDGTENGMALTSNNFIVDNDPPSIPSITSFTKASTSLIPIWSSVSGALEYTVSTTAGTVTTTSDTTVSYIGLSANTLYSFQLLATDSYGNASSYSTVTSTYTNPNIPGTPSVTSGGQTSISVSWSSNGNSAGTIYQLFNVTDDLLITTTTDTSYTVTGLTSGTSYRFKVRAGYFSDITIWTSYSGNSTAISTDVAPAGGGFVNFSVKPINYKGTKFVINNDSIDTISRVVTLNIDSQGVIQMAISNDNSNFSNISYEPYVSTKQWTLTKGDGIKTVYVKLRTSMGGEEIISDTITLIENKPLEKEKEKIKSPVGCPLNIGHAYKSLSNVAVYYIDNAHHADGTINKDIPCTKRPFNSSKKYFTYFDSWQDTTVVDEATLKAIPDDLLGFMQEGPKYNPKYGALVKVITDSKVYLLLGGNRHWISSEVVFTGLGYVWNWIEDITQSLLDKYTDKGEISQTDSRPNYTLIKYKDSPKVYRLESYSKDSTKQIKRWIIDEKIFKSLNLRWDRIMIISDTEVYEDGEIIVGIE